MSSVPAQVCPAGFDRLYGLQVVELEADRAVGKVTVRAELKQPRGIVHGGVYAAIADSLARTATERAVAAEGKIAEGLSNQTSFLRSVRDGTLHAVARARHRGRTTWVWEVEISDEHGARCALARVTLAVSDRPEG